MCVYVYEHPAGPLTHVLVCRDIVSEDVDDFEYTPKPKYPGGQPACVFQSPATACDVLSSSPSHVLVISVLHCIHTVAA